MRGGSTSVLFQEAAKSLAGCHRGWSRRLRRGHPIAQVATYSLVFTMRRVFLNAISKSWSRHFDLLILHASPAGDVRVHRRRHDRYRSPLENLFSLRITRVPDTWRNKAWHRSLHGRARFVVHRGLACCQTGGVEASLGIKKLSRRIGNPAYYIRLPYTVTSFRKITCDICCAIKLLYNHRLKRVINNDFS